MLITKQVIEKIGEFDEQFKEGLYADNDLSKRAIMAGYRALCAGDTFVYHFRSMTFKTHRMNRDKLIAQNKAKFKSKWGE
ncbi:MAG: glycosyltransferase family 2 protein [Bacillota bacterium]